MKTIFEKTLSLSKKGYLRIHQLGFSLPPIILIIALSFFPLFASGSAIGVMIFGLSMGALAMGFNFTAGFIGVVNFGYAAIWGFGGYVSALLVVKVGLPVWFGPIAAMVLAGFLGFLIGVLTLRLHGIFAAVMSWFVALALKGVATSWTSLTNGALGFITPYFFSSPQSLGYYYVILGMVALAYIVFQKIATSDVGLAFKAIGQDVDSAKASGLNPVPYRILNFTISSALAGLIGGFYGHYMGIVSPSLLETSYTIEIMAVAYVGGRGNIPSSLATALILVPILEYLKPLLELRLIIYGVLLVCVMIFFPGGLSDLFDKAMDSIRQRLTN